jgi:hypothetical protein
MANNAIKKALGVPVSFVIAVENTLNRWEKVNLEVFIFESLSKNLINNIKLVLQINNYAVFLGVQQNE